jgi:protein TonB
MIQRLLFICFFSALLLPGTSVSAQGFLVDPAKYGPDTVYITPDITASFPGGKERMYDYIKIKFDAFEDGMNTEGIKEGTIEALFVVEVNGRVKYVSIEKGLSPGFDEEMVRSLTSMPKWKPAMVNGKEVRSLQTVRYTIDFYRR